MDLRHSLFEEDLKNRIEAEKILDGSNDCGDECKAWAKEKLQKFINDKDYRDYIHAAIYIAAAMKFSIVISKGSFQIYLMKTYIISQKLTKRMYMLLKNVIVDELNEIVQKKFEETEFVKEYTRYSCEFEPRMY